MVTRSATRFVLFLVAAAGTASPAWAIPPSIDDPHNSLKTESVNEAAMSQNLELRQWLASHSLDRNAIVQFSSQSPAAATEVAASTDLLQYIVTCALGTSARVTLPTEPEPLRGQIALCGSSSGSTSPYGDWGAASPSPECLQVVSSCVLALVNARERRIPLSLRGFDTTQPTPTPLLGMRDQIPVERQYRELPLSGIPSVTNPCTANGDRRADCGWTALHVGRCERRTPGAASDLPNPTVKLTIRKGGQPVDNLKIRVCKGLYACDYEKCQPDTKTGVCKYSGHIKSTFIQGQSEITFTCPDNGPLITEDRDGLIHRYGYYSVMLAPATSQPLDSDYEIVATPESTGLSHPGHPDFAHYPAREAQVFTYREGAFYGNIFEAVPPPLPPPPPGTLNPDPALRLAAARTFPRDVREPMYACWADGMMDNFISSMDARWCATSADCYISGRPVTCHHLLPLQCGYAGDFDHGAFTQCVPDAAILGVPTIWKHPLTTYLNGPCDLSADDCDPTVTKPTGGRSAGGPLRAPGPASQTSTRR